MFDRYAYPKHAKALCLWLLIFCFCATLHAGLDKTRYIGLNEITTGMDAYCLTVYDGTKIEKFPMKVISIVRGFQPGHDLILVKGTDERFIRTGPVAGCSGSPVYINGRLAGALAVGWAFSKEPTMAPPR